MTDVLDPMKIHLRFGLEQDTTSTEELDFNERQMIQDTTYVYVCTKL